MARKMGNKDNGAFYSLRPLRFDDGPRCGGGIRTIQPFNHSTIQLFNSYTNHAGNVASGVKDIKIGIRAYSRSGN